MWSRARIDFAGIERNSIVLIEWEADRLQLIRVGGSTPPLARNFSSFSSNNSTTVISAQHSTEWRKKERKGGQVTRQVQDAIRKLDH